MAFFRSTVKDPMSPGKQSKADPNDEIFQYSYDTDNLLAKQLRYTDPPSLDMHPLISLARADSISMSKRKCARNACITVVAVVGLLFVFGLILYMIPRDPTVEFKRGEIVLQDSGDILVIETIRLNNPNWQPCYFEDFKMDLFQGSNNVAYTQTGESHKVYARDTKMLDIKFHLELTPEQDAMIRSRCPTAQGVSFTLDGTAEARIWSSDFGKVDIGKWTNILYCKSP